MSREAAYVDPSLTATLHKVSWGAIFAGVVLALAVQFFLNLLGVGIGAAVIDPASYDKTSAWQDYCDGQRSLEQAIKRLAKMMKAAA